MVKIFDLPFVPPPIVEPAPIEHQIADAMQAAGLAPPFPIHIDGKLHRFRSGTKGTPGIDKSGWYVFYSDGIPAGKFGDWRSGIEHNWRADIGRELSPAEEIINQRRMTEAKAARDTELQKSREAAANTVEKIWIEASHAEEGHPYLTRKGIQPHGARITGDGRLIVPLYGDDNKLSSLQYIDPEGGKLYHPGGATGGKYWQIGTTDDPGVIYIAEGFATAATIHETTGRPCIVAYSASNLVPVCGSIRDKFGATQEITIVADNDASGVGQKYADQASAKFGARVIMPPEPGDANDFRANGGDLGGLLVPQNTDWLIPADEFSSQPAPISWLIKSWIQRDALIMVHGPSGGGKTFVVMDWCLHMAAGLPLWAGHKIHPAPVVYLAGEGWHGLRGRIAAWKTHHKAGRLNMWLSKAGCDLNTSDGYWRVVDAVRALPEPPKLIVVDTLHRFLHGDENSAQDAKTMIDACASLMREFSCSVLLVHHTGVSEEAQHRGRGSSAWKGALEIEISIAPGKKGEPISIIPRKMKDGEEPDPIYCELQSVEIPGWLDEDGEPVSSAVIRLTKAPPTKINQKLHDKKKIIEAAWWASGAEIMDGMPYLTKNALLNYMQRETKYTGTTAERYAKTSSPFIQPMMDIFLKEHASGWVICDQEAANILMMRKNNG